MARYEGMTKIEKYPRYSIRKRVTMGAYRAVPIVCIELLQRYVIFTQPLGEHTFEDMKQPTTKTNECMKGCACAFTLLESDLGLEYCTLLDLSTKQLLYAPRFSSRHVFINVFPVTRDRYFARQCKGMCRMTCD